MDDLPLIKSNGTKVPQHKRYDTKELQLKSNDVELSQLKSNNTKVSQLKSNDTRVSQLKSNDTKVSQLKSNDTKVSQLKSNDTKVSQLRKNDVVEIVIEDIGSDGEGIGRYYGFTLFVKGAVTRDKMRVQILKVKKSYGYAKLLEILEESPYRTKPLCPIAIKCGGCQMQHIAYEFQLEYKRNKVIHCLRRIAGITEFDIEPVIGMEVPYYYRNKVQLPVGRDKEGKVIIGFYAGHTHSIIDTEKCYIQPGISELIVGRVREFLNEENISVYDEKLHQGLVRHVLIRIGFHTGDVMVCLVINGSRMDKAGRLVSRVKEIEELQGFYKIKSVCLNRNVEETNVILGNQIIPVFGETYITDFIGEVKYRISPVSFFQINPYQTVKLYDKVLSYADLSGREVVWDLYCGIGTISLYLAKKAKWVYGVEIIPRAVEDAKENARINEVDNASFFTGAAEEVLPEKYKKDNGMRADVIVVDPPRKGCDVRLLDTIVNMEPARIVYVSCDPGTLARDVKYLDGKGYEVKNVAVVDQFGMTTHVECVVLLTRTGAEKP